MKRYTVQKALAGLLTLLVFADSCRGQADVRQKQALSNEQKGISTRPVKIIRAQGSDRYQAVSCGIQDKAGRLWLGTSGEGVYRYDGKNFTNFTQADGLSSNSVRCMLEDKSGKIWFGTNTGLCCYDGTIFTTIPVTVLKGGYCSAFSGKIPAGNPEVRSLLQDKKGTIWIGTSDDGVFCYDGSVFTRFLHKDGVGNKDGLLLNAVSAIIEDKTGSIWFATWFEGICRYDGRSVNSFKPNGELWYASVFEAKNGDIWLGRRTKGLCRYDGKSFVNIEQHGILDSCCVMAITEDQRGCIWFGTEAADMTKRETQGGVWRWNGRSFENFTQKDGLGNYSVFCMIPDRKGNVWAGTRNTGLYRYDGNSFSGFSE